MDFTQVTEQTSCKSIDNKSETSIMEVTGQGHVRGVNLPYVIVQMQSGNVGVFDMKMCDISNPQFRMVPALNSDVLYTQLHPAVDLRPTGLFHT